MYGKKSKYRQYPEYSATLWRVAKCVRGGTKLTPDTAKRIWNNEIGNKKSLNQDKPGEKTPFEATCWWCWQGTCKNHGSWHDLSEEENKQRKRQGKHKSEEGGDRRKHRGERRDRSEQKKQKKDKGKEKEPKEPEQ